MLRKTKKIRILLAQYSKQFLLSSLVDLGVTGKLIALAERFGISFHVSNVPEFTVLPL